MMMKQSMCVAGLALGLVSGTAMAGTVEYTFFGDITGGSILSGGTTFTVEVCFDSEPVDDGSGVYSPSEMTITSGGFSQTLTSGLGVEVVPGSEIFFESPVFVVVLFGGLLHIPDTGLPGEDALGELITNVGVFEFDSSEGTAFGQVTGGSVSVPNSNPVPLPSAAGLAFAGLGLVAVRRRR